jgi:hypothetical protein
MYVVCMCTDARFVFQLKTHAFLFKAEETEEEEEHPQMNVPAAGVSSVSPCDSHPILLTAAQAARDDGCDRVLRGRARRVDRGDRARVPHPAHVHRPHPAPDRRQRRGARDVDLDGDEEQDGAHDRHLRWLFDPDRVICRAAARHRRLDVSVSGMCASLGAPADVVTALATS